MHFLKGISYFIKSVLLMVALLLAFTGIATIDPDSDTAMFVFMGLFIVIPPQLTLILDLGDGWGLFVKDISGCVVGAIVGFLVYLVAANYIHTHQALVAGILVLIVAVVKAIDAYKFQVECALFSNIIAWISTGCIAINGLILIFTNDANFIADGLGAVLLVITLLTWIYTIFAHSIHAGAVAEYS